MHCFMPAKSDFDGWNFDGTKRPWQTEPFRCQLRGHVCQTTACTLLPIKPVNFVPLYCKLTIKIRSVDFCFRQKYYLSFKFVYEKTTSSILFCRLLTFKWKMNIFPASLALSSLTLATDSSIKSYLYWRRFNWLRSGLLEERIREVEASPTLVRGA